MEDDILKLGQNAALAKPRRRDWVVRQLRDDIVLGILPPGEIIRDVELANRYGVSTSPIREALTALEAEFLIDMPPNQAKRVAPIGRKRTEEMFDLLTILMSAAVARGVSNLEAGDVQALDELNAKLAKSHQEGSIKIALEIQRAFLDVIIRASKNDVLRRTIARHAAWTERLYHLYIPLDQAGMLDLTDGLLQAIHKGSERDASLALQQSHDNLRAIIAKLPMLTP